CSEGRPKFRAPIREVLQLTDGGRCSHQRSRALRINSGPSFLVLPPSANTAIQVSDPLEAVHFFRDGMANIVWAVESIVTGGAGAQWPGAERSAALSPRQAQPPAGAALRYLIQTPVPYNWIPFLPVTIDPTVGTIALERAAMLDVSANPPKPIEPVGRILRPRRGASPY